MKKKIILSIILVFVVSVYIVNVSATGLLNNIFTQGTNFGKNGTVTNNSIGSKLSGFIKGDVMTALGLIGNLIFAGVTVILGVKYIWSSADGKASVLESLPTFVVAVIFFYLGGTLVTWLGDAADPIKNATSWDTISGTVIGTINLVVQYAAFGGILVLGLKYMFASAEGRAQLKTNMGGFIIGLVFVFCASKVVEYIVAVGNNVL